MSRRHDFTLGPTRRMIEAKKFRVTYRAQETPDSPREIKQIIMVVPLLPTDQRDGLDAVDARLRRVRQMNPRCTIELIKIEDLGDEVPVQPGGTPDTKGKSIVVSEQEYKDALQKQKEEKKGEIILPGQEGDLE